MSPAQPVRVAINAQIQEPSGAGGIVTVLIGLVHALGRLEGPDEYVVIGPPDGDDWLRPYLGANQRWVRGPARKSGPLARPRRLLGRLTAPGGRIPRVAGVPRSDGWYERLGCQAIHFPYQNFVATAIPSVYNPHDLLHVHHPELFDEGRVRWRDRTYRIGCEMSAAVVVASDWSSRDLQAHFGLSAERVHVIPWAPTTEAYAAPTPEDMARARETGGGEGGYALYPAMTWPHKNHLRLLDALALARDRHGVDLRLVCTGKKTEHWPRLEARIRELDLEDQVRFPGLVDPGVLRALYRAARFVVVPTLFEAASGPMFEAWQDNVPVAAAAVTSLPEQAGDAALLFDPLAVDDIAEAVARMATDASLRDRLRERGRRRLADFSWDRTARAYRAVYRLAAGRALTEEDRHLLAWDWMRESQ